MRIGGRYKRPLKRPRIEWFPAGEDCMPVSLSTAAAERVRSFLEARGHGVGLRLGIKRTGCSGYAYVVNFAEAIESGDTVFEDQGIQVVVAADSLEFVDGTEVDFVRHGLNEAFKFRNPRAKAECGCGESFSF
jgi:iron-sulfur cluster assembly protein